MKVYGKVRLLGCQLLAWIALSKSEVLDATTPIFTIEDDVFKLDGNFFRILSGRWVSHKSRQEAWEHTLGHLSCAGLRMAMIVQLALSQNSSCILGRPNAESQGPRPQHYLGVHLSMTQHEA